MMRMGLSTAMVAVMVMFARNSWAQDPSPNMFRYKMLKMADNLINAVPLWVIVALVLSIAWFIATKKNSALMEQREVQGGGVSKRHLYKLQMVTLQNRIRPWLVTTIGCFMTIPVPIIWVCRAPQGGGHPVLLLILVASLLGAVVTSVRLFVLVLQRDKLRLNMKNEGIDYRELLNEGRDMQVKAAVSGSGGNPERTIVAPPAASPRSQITLSCDCPYCNSGFELPPDSAGRIECRCPKCQKAFNVEIG